MGIEGIDCSSRDSTLNFPVLTSSSLKGGDTTINHVLGEGEGVDNPQATLSSRTKVWVEGGREGVDIRAAAAMAWSLLASEVMEIGIGGGGLAAVASMRWKLWEPGYRETIDDPPK